MVSPCVGWYKSRSGFDYRWWWITTTKSLCTLIIFWTKHDICITTKHLHIDTWEEYHRFLLGFDLTTFKFRVYCYAHCAIVYILTQIPLWKSLINLGCLYPQRVIDQNDLFDILDFRCQLQKIRLLKTLPKRRMFISFMNISACWLLHRLIKFNKVCWEKRPVKPRPNLQTSFCRRSLKNNQPHLKWKQEFQNSTSKRKDSDSLNYYIKAVWCWKLMKLLSIPTKQFTKVFPF